MENKIKLEKEIHLKTVVYIGFDQSVNETLMAGNINVLNLSRSFFEDRHSEAISNVDCVLCDNTLQDDTGFDFYQKIYRKSSWMKIPFILIDNSFSEEFKQQCLSAKINDLQRKPLNIAFLKTRIAFLHQFINDDISLPDIDSLPTFKLPIWKRMFDIVAASVLLMPVCFLFIVIPIYNLFVSRGPLFYLSDRVGSGYKIFKFIKFRSMYVDADQRLVEYIKSNAHGTDAKTIKIENDPRITAGGKILRKYSIDELPQLLNVLKGEMSIVGNRPLPLYEAREFTVDNISERFIAPAGMTGLWQVQKDRNKMPDDERMAFDVRYAKEFSFKLDLQILRRTLKAAKSNE